MVGLGCGVLCPAAAVVNLWDRSGFIVALRALLVLGLCAAILPACGKATSTCEIESYRYSRDSRGTCHLEPLTKAKPGQVCTTTLEKVDCPPVLSGTGFILRDGDKCTLTLVTEDGRTTSDTACPPGLVNAGR